MLLPRRRGYFTLASWHALNSEQEIVALHGEADGSSMALKLLHSMLVESFGASSLIGNYRIGRRLAAGGMAEIYTAEAVGKGFGQPIVIKRMLPHLAHDRRFVDMFIDEARLSTRLDHPNIVRVYDFEATEHGLFLVMERVDGPDLLAVLKRCAKMRIKVPTELAVYIACHVLEALDYAHSVSANGRRLNVVHRDVSPSNVLLSRRGRVKLADFGIARGSQRQDKTATGTLKGKHGYMSPEQIGGGRIDSRSDIFSAAIVLAEMLMGRRLFTAASDLETLLMVRRADLSRLDKYGASIPKSLDAIVRRGLIAHRERRFASAGEFMDVLAQWLAQADARAGASRMAEFVRSLELDGGDLCSLGRPRTDSSNTMSGTQTRLARLAIKKSVVVGRQIYALGGTGEACAPSSNSPEITLEPYSAPSANHVAQSSAGWQLCDEVSIAEGALGTVPLVDVLCAIAQQALSGKLVVQHNDRVTEAYVLDGNPVFVRSNVPHHRFGQYLVAQGILTEQQLARALAALPQCGGRLGQTLVSLQLLSAVEAVRLLADQVAFKLIDTCAWTRGTYRFYPGERNPWPALQLDLNTFEIVAQSVHTIPRPLLRQWQERFSDALPTADPECVVHFAFDAYLQAHLRGMRGFRALDSLTDDVVEPRRAEFVACAYTLWRCGGIEFADTVTSSTETVIARAAPPDSEYPRDRKHRRVRYCAPGEIVVTRKGKATQETRTIPIEICDVTCTGVGVRSVFQDRYELSRGLTVTLRFSNDKDELELPGRIAWCTSDGQRDSDIGVELLLEVAPACMREAYANWVVGLIARTPET